MNRPRIARAGGTLIEMLIAISIFLFAMGAMFVLFQKSYQSFHFLEQRQSVQSQVLRVSSALEADFRLTHLSSVGIQERPTTIRGETVQRDLISCLIVDDWHNPDNFYPDTGIPRWNRYAVYLCDLEDNGRLERVVFEPDPPETGSQPIVGLLGMTSLASDRIRSRQMLCENLLSWDCETDIVKRSVKQTLRLRKKGARRGLDDKEVEESFEARFSWTPKNTVPKL